MSLYLDSAFPEDARLAFNTGLVSGITTNPSLMAKTGRPAEDVIAELCDISTGIVFHQLTGDDLESRRNEALKFTRIHPGRVGLKIPCSYENLSLAAELVKTGCMVGITAIFTTSQVYLACQAAVQFILPYVNRSTRLLGDGIDLVKQMQAVIEAECSATQIIAASIKTPDEAISTVMAGAHHLTLTLQLIQTMGNHPLSDKTVEEFKAAARS